MINNYKAGSITVLVLLTLGALSLIGAGLGIKSELKSRDQARIGAFRPSSYSGKLLTRLAEGGSETTFRTSPGEGKDGTTLTTTKLGDFIVITVNPGASNEEKISVSAVSTTGSTTATWTIVNRGLSFTSNTSVSGNIKQHAIGEAVIISNDDHYLAQQYVNVDDAQTINGVKTFASTSQPIYDGAPTFTNARSLIDKGYADGLAFQGVATATENTVASTPGAVMLARLADAVGSVASSSSGAPLVLLSRYSTSTYNPASAGNVLVMTGTGGKIDSNFVSTSSNYTWSGTHNYTSTLALGSTTPVATFSVQGNAFVSGTTTSSGLTIASSTSIGANLSVSGVCTGCAATVQSYIPRMPGAATTTSISFNSGGTPPVNAAQFEIPFRQTFQKISYNASTQSSDGGLDVKIFAEDGTTVVLATTTGAATTVGINTITASSTFTLAPGIYWMAFMPHPPGLITLDLWSYLANPFLTLNNVSGEPRVVCQYARTANQFKMPGVIDTTGCSVTQDTTQLGGLIFRLDN